MNDEQKLRLRVASEQMAALQADPDRRDWTWKALAEYAVEAADALIAEVERTAKADPAPMLAPVEAVPPKHPGWVFVDRDGDVWGCRDHWRNGRKRAFGSFASRPFLTREEAEEQGAQCGCTCEEVREWRPTDNVPPMPEVE